MLYFPYHFYQYILLQVHIYQPYNNECRQFLYFHVPHPLIQHLIELRSRLIKSIILISILFVIAYIYADSIYNFLVQPYADAVAGEAGRRLIFTALHETFFTYLKVALFASLFIALPFILIQIWKFIAPGLYKHEKTAILPYLVLTPILCFDTYTIVLTPILKYFFAPWGARC